MKGHLQIIAARQKYLKPTAIFFELGRDPIQSKYSFDNPEFALDVGIYPTVFVPANEVLVRHDLRFASGIQSHVFADSLTDDVIKFAERLVDAGCPHMIACDGHEVLEYINGDYKAWTF